MAYDALKRGRDILIAASSGTLPTVLDAVELEHGVTVGGPRAVYRCEEARPMYPNIEVSPPRGSLLSLSKGNVTTLAEYWLIASVTSADPLWLDDALMAYATAIVRVTSDLDSSQAEYTCEPVQFDFSPPLFTDDTTQKRSVGVLIRMEFTEAV